MSIDLPPELLSEIAKYIYCDYDDKICYKIYTNCQFDHDYRNRKNYHKILHSCILVNKQWHNIMIPYLWKDQFCHYSTDILINCLLTEDKDFLVENEIELNFELLKKPPLHNYAKFTTELNFDNFDFKMGSLVKNRNENQYKCLGKRLLKFILDHAVIRKLDCNTSERRDILAREELINYHSFDACFRNLYEFSCDIYCYNELVDRLTIISKNIQVLTIYFTGGFLNHDRVYKLIKAQHQVKKLVLAPRNYREKIMLTDDLKDAILFHSKSIVSYESYAENKFNSLIVPTFQNLKRIVLIGKHDLKDLISIVFPKLEYLRVNIYCEDPSDLSDFIKINGKTLKILYIYGNLSYVECLEKLLYSIRDDCKNLEHIFTMNDQKFAEISNDCIKLKQIHLIE